MAVAAEVRVEEVAVGEGVVRVTVVEVGTVVVKWVVLGAVKAVGAEATTAMETGSEAVGMSEGSMVGVLGKAMAVAAAGSWVVGAMVEALLVEHLARGEGV